MLLKGPFTQWPFTQWPFPSRNRATVQAMFSGLEAGPKTDWCLSHASIADISAADSVKSSPTTARKFSLQSRLRRRDKGQHSQGWWRENACGGR